MSSFQLAIANVSHDSLRGCKKVTGGILTRAQTGFIPAHPVPFVLSEELVDTPEMDVAYRAAKESAYWRT